MTPLEECVRQFHVGGYEVGPVALPVCACGGRSFEVWVMPDVRSVRRVCLGCGAAAFIADSEEYWEDGEAEVCACSCGEEEFSVAVGFSLRAGGDVRWVTVGLQCSACGHCGVYEDWKISYAPTAHLLTQV